MGFVSKFFLKKLDFFKTGEVGKFAAEGASNGIISLKCVSYFSCKVFFAKNRKIFICGNFTKFDEMFFEKKRFHLFRSHSGQNSNSRVENVPVVAGRAVITPTKFYLVTP